MVIFAQLQRLFSPRPDKIRAGHLYKALVEQARQPVFYTHYGVPDTLDGRFDLIILHLHLVLQRLQSAFQRAPELHELSRLLIETYFADMDRSLREMGVGDTGVSYRVRKMTSAFYGRIEAYGMATEDPRLWPEALSRNLYGTCPDAPDADSILAMIAYINGSAELLATLDDGFGAESLRFAPLSTEFAAPKPSATESSAAEPSAAEPSATVAPARDAASHDTP